MDIIKNIMENESLLAVFGDLKKVFQENGISEELFNKITSIIESSKFDLSNISGTIDHIKEVLIENGISEDIVNKIISSVNNFDNVKNLTEELKDTSGDIKSVLENIGSFLK